MKADEYVSKYEEDLTALKRMDIDNATPDERRVAVSRMMAAIDNVIVDFIDEFNAIRIQRHASTTRAIFAITKELEQKFQRMLRLLEHKYGDTIFREDALINEFNKLHITATKKRYIE